MRSGFFMSIELTVIFIEVKCVERSDGELLMDE